MLTQHGTCSLCCAISRIACNDFAVADSVVVDVDEVVCVVAAAAAVVVDDAVVVVVCWTAADVMTVGVDAGCYGPGAS